MTGSSVRGNLTLETPEMLRFVRHAALALLFVPLAASAQPAPADGKANPPPREGSSTPYAAVSRSKQFVA